MTSEEAVRILRESNITYIAPNGKARAAEALDMAIEALKHEPFINKPCVAHEACHEDKVKVLDRMKAEFISLYPKNYAGGLELSGCSCVFSLNQVLKIIDKYKVEGEET